jgi:hypothetical protein
MTQVSLTLSGFKTWLEALPLGNVAGDKTEPTSCPIARFLKTKTDLEIYVHSDKYKFISQDAQGKKVQETEHLPYWAIRFVDKVDSSDTSNPFVTVSEALGLLKEIETRR